MKADRFQTYVNVEVPVDAPFPTTSTRTFTEPAAEIPRPKENRQWEFEEFEIYDG